MKIAVESGIYLEGDDGPRNTRWHHRIVRVEKIRNTQSGNYVTLECGHTVQAFGDLSQAAGIILCLKCRDYDEGAAS
jgi:hypothetical protein